MKYIRVKWTHGNPDEPVWLFSELDDAGREVRKIECFKNGFCDFACLEKSSGATRLHTTPLPDIFKKAPDPEFETDEITPQEFEEVWVKRTYKK